MPSRISFAVDRRLVDHHRLEASLEGGVLLDVLAVLVEGRRPDALQLAPRQRRLRMFAASIAPSAAPAPTRVWSSSMNRTESLLERSSSMIFFNRSSNSPRHRPGHQRTDVQGEHALSRSVSGTSPDTIRWASASAIAVLPTPGSPMSGLFFVLRLRIWMTRSISFSRLMRVELAGPGELGQVDAQLVEGRCSR